MGTWTVIETPESRSMTLATPGDEHQFEVVYLVTWVPANDADPFPGEAALRGQLPYTRSRLPSAIYGSSTFLKAFVCRSVEIQPQRERTYSWRAACRYGTYYNEGDWAWGQCTRSSSVRQVSMYRMNPTFPTNGTVTWPTGVVDIGGTKVDLSGNPRPYDVPQQQITIEYLWDRTFPSGAPKGEPTTTTWASYIGKRNNGALLGCPQGTLLYQGFQVAPQQEWYRIQHNFIYDEWYHLEQVPAPVPTGAPLCTQTVATVMGLDVLQADKVGWFQRYAEASIYSVLDTQVLAEFTTPVPAFP